jgi:hypothetical protein
MTYEGQGSVEADKSFPFALSKAMSPLVWMSVSEIPYRCCFFAVPRTQFPQGRFCWVFPTEGMSAFDRRCEGC